MDVNISVKTAARTLDVFECFAEARRPLSLSELARAIEAPVSSCFALIRTLEDRGYLYTVGRRRAFYPTKRMTELAEVIRRHDPIVERLAPTLAELRDQTGESIILGKRQGDQVVYLDFVEGRQTVRYIARVGDRKPLHSSAIGKVMLGQLGPAELDATIARLELAAVTDRTITEPARLKREVRAAGRRGWYRTRGENVADVTALAVALALGGEPFGLAVAGPSSRIATAERAIVGRLVDLKHRAEAA